MKHLSHVTSHRGVVIDRPFLLTTGMIAKAVGVAPRSVSKWFDTGLLKGYLIPGSNDRRVTAASFLEFLRENKMDVPRWLLPEGVNLTFGVPKADVPQNWQAFDSPVALGVAMAKAGVVDNLIVSDSIGLYVALDACLQCRLLYPTAETTLLASDDVPDQSFPFVSLVARHPFNWTEYAKAA